MLLIVLNHTIEMGTKVPVESGFPPVAGGLLVVLNQLKNLGVFGVPVFLFISGAFTSYAAKGTPPKLTARFLFAVLSRICCPYVLWSAAFYSVIFLQFGEKYTPQGYIKNLLVGYPFHFIPLLLFFYLVSPLLVRLGRRHGLSLVVGFGAYQLLLLGVLRTTALPQQSKILVPPVLGGTLALWAIYFPLGLVYGLHKGAMLPCLQKAKVLSALSAAVLFVLGVLDSTRILDLPLAISLAPIAFVMILPVIDRQSIPLVEALETIGKRSYGLYLTQLLVLDLTLLAAGTFVPWLLGYSVALFPLLFMSAIAVPLLVMQGLARSPARAVHRYVFG